MNENEIRSLRGEVEKSMAVLGRIHGYLHGYVANRLTNRDTDSALVVAGTLENYYTAAETLFVRVSQAFENNVSPHRWHSELLHKMTVHVPDVRPGVLSDRTADLMGELLRFRHFKRYYFSLDYDWRRLDALLGIFEDAHKGLSEDLAGFLQALV